MSENLCLRVEWLKIKDELEIALSPQSNGNNNKQTRQTRTHDGFDRNYPLKYYKQPRRRFIGKKDYFETNARSLFLEQVHFQTSNQRCLEEFSDINSASVVEDINFAGADSKPQHT